MTKPTGLTDRNRTGSSSSSSTRRSRGGRRRSAIAWTLAGAWGAWAAARLTGADRIPLIEMPLTPVLSATPYVAAAAPIPIVCAVVLRRPRAAIASGLAAGAFAAMLLPRAIPSGGPAAKGPALRVLTANLLFSDADPNRVVDLVRTTHADVLSVQELTEDGVEALDKAGLRAELPYQVLDPRQGPAGSGLYARYPLHAIAPVPGTTMAMPQAELTLPGGARAAITVVHPVPPYSRPNIRDWRHDLDALPTSGSRGPVRILAGDYNATLDHAAFRSLLGKGYADASARAGKALVFTWGVSKFGPPLTLDHVLVDKRVQVRRVDIYDLPGSDHRAVFADLRLP